MYNNRTKKISGIVKAVLTSREALGGILLSCFVIAALITGQTITIVQQGLNARAEQVIDATTGAEKKEVEVTVTTKTATRPQVTTTKKAVKGVVKAKKKTTTTTTTTTAAETTTTVAETEYVATENAGYVSQSDWYLLCNLVGREYGADWVPVYEKAKVVACVMSRVNSDEFPNTIAEVISQPGQFPGWLPDYCYTDQVTESVEEAVNYYFQNQATFGQYYFYYGDGVINYFYN